MAVKARAEITLSSIRDVQSVTRYYLLQSSTSTAPAKPTKNPPGGNWVTTEPTYTSGSTNSLYFTDCTVFSDGSFVYSDVSLSSSYEAAKVAYNKAVAAQQSIDGMQFGGRNLLLNSSFTNDYDKWSNSGHEIVIEDGLLCGHIAGVLSATKNISQSIFAQIKDDNLTQLYTVSADIKLVNYVAGSTNPYVALYFSGSYDNNGKNAWLGATYVGGTIKRSDNNLPPFNNQGWVHVTYIFRFAHKPLSMNFLIYSRDWEGDLYYRNVKLERGNKASDWTPAPEDLEAEVNAAQETANGKNTVYYQAEAPSGGTYKVNDIWFETDNGNKMYMWNGTTWVAEQFGNAAISDLAITNAKIANATIQSAKIANLDAGKITTGTMSANRIKGDTLTLGGANNVDGMLKVYDANGTLVGSFTREGLMAIAGTIGGWTIGATQLYNTYLEDNAIQHSAAFSPTDELQFSVSDNGTGTTMLDVHDRTAIYGSNGINFAVRTLDDEWYQSYVAPRGDDYGVRIGPALDVYGPLSSSSMKSSSLELQTNMGSYIRQPAMIMAGVVTISTGTSEKNLTLCTVPTEYQSGYRIVPFVSRRYGSASGTPSDTGDFYYAYYNSVTHKVHIKLANKLPSGVIFQFDYMIYAVPES